MDGTLEVLRELGQPILDPIPRLLGLYVDMEIRFEITRSIETARLYTDEAWCNVEFRDQGRAALGATKSPYLFSGISDDREGGTCTGDLQGLLLDIDFHREWATCLLLTVTAVTIKGISGRTVHFISDGSTQTTAKQG
jgi:hypothetical protein